MRRCSPASPLAGSLPRLPAVFMRWLVNSALISVVSVLITLALASLAAYAFSRLPFPGRSVTFTLMISLMVVPLALVRPPLGSPSPLAG